MTTTHSSSSNIGSVHDSCSHETVCVNSANDHILSDFDSHHAMQQQHNTVVQSAHEQIILMAEASSRRNGLSGYGNVPFTSQGNGDMVTTHPSSAHTHIIQAHVPSIHSDSMKGMPGIEPLLSSQGSRNFDHSLHHIAVANGSHEHVDGTLGMSGAHGVNGSKTVSLLQPRQAGRLPYDGQTDQILSHNNDHDHDHDVDHHLEAADHLKGEAGLFEIVGPMLHMDDAMLLAGSSNVMAGSG